MVIQWVQRLCSKYSHQIAVFGKFVMSKQSAESKWKCDPLRWFEYFGPAEWWNEQLNVMNDLSRRWITTDGLWKPQWNSLLIFDIQKFVSAKSSTEENIKIEKKNLHRTVYGWR